MPFRASQKSVFVQNAVMNLFMNLWMEVGVFEEYAVNLFFSAVMERESRILVKFLLRAVLSRWISHFSLKNWCRKCQKQSLVNLVLQLEFARLSTQKLFLLNVLAGTPFIVNRHCRHYTNHYCINTQTQIDELKCRCKRCIGEIIPPLHSSHTV